MADEIIDRGDELTTGDTTGDTADLTADQIAEKAAKDKELADAAAAELGIETPEAKAIREKTEREKDIKIPKARMDEAVAKARKEAEVATNRANELEAQIKAQKGEVDAEKVEKQLDEAEDKLEKAIADNNTELKAALRREIRQLNRQISDSNAAAHAARATAVAVEQIRYDALVGTMEAEHPELNPDNDTYDQESVDELGELKAGFEALGHSSSEALKKALKAVYRDGPKPKVDAVVEKTEEELKAEAEADKAKEAKAAKVVEDRKAAVAAKAIADKKRQPADTKKAGLDSDGAGIKDGQKLKPSQMTDKEWDALTEDQLKELRGDKL